jgi:alpha-L-fucosidase
MASSRSSIAQLRRRQIPSWWQDAKLGIFVQWSPASVPAFAPREDDYSGQLIKGQSDAFAYSPYVEWYENSLRFDHSPVSAFHREHYGDLPYSAFAKTFEESMASWNPAAWASSFAATGARYVVLMTKHHDGYCLWPTEIENPHRPGWHSSRDVVGELAEAVRNEGMRFGIYYSGGLDWTFCDDTIGTPGDMIAAVPRGSYVEYAEAQVRELIDRYQPSVLWNDITWPSDGPALWKLFEDYYATVPDGVVNDRWMPWSPVMGLSHNTLGRKLIERFISQQTAASGGLIPPKPPYFDYRTPEYMTFPDVQRTPFECIRGIDNSFGYNAASAPEDFLSREALLWLLSDITAKGGNLLLSVGPRGVDGQISEEQQARLDWLAEWAPTIEQALQGTRPWVAAGDLTPEGTPIRYTTRGQKVFALLQSPGPKVTLSALSATSATAVELLGGDAVPWESSDSGIVVHLSERDDHDQPVVIEIHNAAARHTAK